MSFKDYFKKGFGGTLTGSSYVPGWQPGDNGYVLPMNTWTQVVTELPKPRFYFCSRPGKRWKK